MRSIAAAANTLVPAILALEAMGFTLESAVEGDPSLLCAIRGEERYVAPDPVTLLGLLKLVELRSWDWRASDAELERVLSDSR